MKFRDLLTLPKDRLDRLNKLELMALLPNTPEDVIEQFYVDHGINKEFQQQYSDINLNEVVWEVVSVNYDTLSKLSVFPDFVDWVNRCAKKSLRVAKNDNWKRIDHAQDVVNYWQLNKTWQRKPIVILKGDTLHLVEGHSRFGCLKGLIKANVISNECEHKIWLGKNVSLANSANHDAATPKGC